MTEYIEIVQNTINPQKPEGEDEDVAPEEPAPIGHCQDLLGDRKIFQWAGIGFGEQESYML